MAGPSSPQRVSFSFTLDGGRDVVIELDASVNEQHQGSAQVTEHPVETGTSIVDNIRPLPRKLTIEGMVSNTPIYPAVLQPSSRGAGNANAKIPSQTINFSEGGSVTTPDMSSLQFDSQFYRVEEVYGDLVDAYQQGVFVDIFTTLQSYTQFAITSLNVPRNVKNSNSTQFTIELQEILTVDVQEVTSLAAKHVEKKKGDTPKKTPTPAQEKEQKRSLLKSIIKAAIPGQ